MFLYISYLHNLLRKESKQQEGTLPLIDLFTTKDFVGGWVPTWSIFGYMFSHISISRILEHFIDPINFCRKISYPLKKCSTQVPGQKDDRPLITNKKRQVTRKRIKINCPINNSRRFWEIWRNRRNSHRDFCVI